MTFMEANSADARHGAIRHSSVRPQRFARHTESAIVPSTRGDGRAMSSRASRTAAMMLAQIAIVDANLSGIASCWSRSTARRLKPMLRV